MDTSQKMPPERPSSTNFLFNAFVAGLQYYEALTVWTELKVGSRLTLMPEPHNRYDRHAIMVLHNDVLLGYIPRSENRHMAKLLNVGWNPYEVFIQGIYDQHSMNERLEVCIRVKPCHFE